ncbi:MAG: hypothetical protein KAF27_01430 [Porphyrobacter sp.]|nr:hypothetical protein [Porphyrobacter sp.]
MTGTLARLGAFSARWNDRLCAGSAVVRIETCLLDSPPGLHTACADAFVTGFGYLPIGGNWELLDPDAAPDAPRSALAALGQAFANNMVYSSEPWLGEADALAMGADFLACFAPASRQIVTNRMYFGWNPITDATFEWAFVAFDGEAIALLLVTDED